VKRHFLPCGSRKCLPLSNYMDVLLGHVPLGLHQSGLPSLLDDLDFDHQSGNGVVGQEIFSSVDEEDLRVPMTEWEESVVNKYIRTEKFDLNLFMLFLFSHQGLNPWNESELLEEKKKKNLVARR